MELTGDYGALPSSDELVLDFINSTTGMNTATNRWEDSLVDAFATLTWLRERDTLSSESFRVLMHLVSSDQDTAASLQCRANELRHSLHEIFRSIAHGDTTPPSQALDILNTFVAQENASRRLVWSAEGMRVQWNLGATFQLEYTLWPIVVSAEALLTSERIRRVKECASSTCEWLFLDTSKNNSRRWCRMDVCGNREKGRRRLRREREYAQ